MRIPSIENLDSTYAWLRGCKHAKALYIPPKSGRFLWSGLTDTEKAECEANNGKLPWTSWNSAWKAFLVNYEYTMTKLIESGRKVRTLNKETNK